VWVDPVYKCINECSAIIEGRSYVESLSTNDCVLNTEHKHEEEPKPEEKKYNFKIIDSNPDALKLQEELQNNISKLYQYVMEDLKLRQKLKEAKKLQPEAEDICNLQGRIREEIGEDQETSLYCECFENAFGSRCQYYSELFYEFNSYAELVLRKVRKVRMC
jgi:flagellin-specific chaperone FliS